MTYLDRIIHLEDGKVVEDEIIKSEKGMKPSIFNWLLENLKGAGLRNTAQTQVQLSFAFVIIIFFNGIMDGWNEQAKRDSIAWQYGQGQLIHKGL